MTGTTSDDDSCEECRYAQCICNPTEQVEGPDGVYEFCAYHARRMVERSPNFEWRRGIA